jgi:hypothetical protein
MRATSWAGCGLVVALGVAACSSPPRGDQAGGDKSSTPAAARSAEVILTTVKWPALESAIASHKGKVVVLDVWGEF